MKHFIKIVLFLYLISNNTYAMEEYLFVGNEAKAPKIWKEDGVAKGILVDILREVGKGMKVKIKIELYPWKRAYIMAEQGAAGIIGLSKTEERLALFDYSDAVFYDDVLFVVKKGKEFTYEGNEDLKGKKIGNIRGASFGPVYEESKKYFNLIDGNNHKALFKMLLADRLDAVLVSPGEAALRMQIQEDSFLSENKKEFVALPHPLTRDPNFVAFAKSKKMDKFIKKFNKHLKAAMVDGTLKTIIDSYK